MLIIMIEAILIPKERVGDRVAPGDGYGQAALPKTGVAEGQMRKEEPD